MWRTRVGEYARHHPYVCDQWDGQEKLLKLAMFKLCSVTQESAICAKKGEVDGKVRY